jgi:hypothetical protein
MKKLSLNIGGILNRGNARYPSGRIWPDGTFSLGYVAPRQDERLDDREPGYSHPGDDDNAARAPLDLRDVPNSDKAPRSLLSAGPDGSKGTKRPETYGRKGMTGYGRNMIRSVGALIDRFYPNHRVTFATITMPELPQRERTELARAWPRLVNELQKWLKRRLEKKGLPQVVLSVSEIQTGRLEAHEEAYLHLHLLWLNAPGRAGNWSVDVLDLRAWLENWLIRNGLWNNDSHVNVDTRSVKGEKSRYLAKYCSKGSDEIEKFASEHGWECIPSQWWNVTNVARDWVKTYTVKGREAGEFLDCLINETFDSGEFSHLHYLYHIDIEVNGRALNVGWRGGLTIDAWLDAVGWELELGPVW